MDNEEKVQKHIDSIRGLCDDLELSFRVGNSNFFRNILLEVKHRVDIIGELKDLV